MIDGMDDIIRGVERLMGSIIEKLEEQNRIIATLQKEVAELKEKSYKTISETVESVEQPIEELTIEFPVESSIEPVQTHTIESKNYSWMVDIPGPKVELVQSSLSVNDRIIFINELCEGNREEFNSLIDRINQTPTFNEVVDMVHELYPQWDDNSDIVYRFYMMVRRRFR